MIDRATLAQLVAGADPAVSIYLTIDPEQRDTRPAEAGLRELTAKAQQMLAPHHHRPELIAQILGPVLNPDLGREIEEHRDHGRVFFLASAFHHVVSLPEPVPSSATVGADFLLRPLLPALARNRRFHILALSAGATRLFDATPFGMAERAGALPASGSDLWLPARGAEPVPLGPTGQPPSAAPVPDIAREPAETESTSRHEFLDELNRLAAAVAHALSGDPAPLVLAAEPEAAGHFRKFAKVPQLCAETLRLDPGGLSDRDLLAKATALLEPLLDRELAGVLDQANARLGTAEPTVAIRLEEILAAAYDGRIDAVVVASDETLWGRYDRQARIVHAEGTPNGGADLLNEAAVVSLRRGGRAFAAPKQRIPRRAPAVATLRY